MPRRHFPLVLIIVAYVIVALGFNLVVPVGESPDEPTHLEYVYYLRQNRALPHLSLPGGTGITQGGHPPLYYLLGAALTFWAPAESPERVTNPHFTFNMETMQAPNAFVHVREAPFPYSGQPEVLAVHVARLISLLAGVVTIISAYLIGRTVLPSRPYVAWGAAALVAFLPGYVFFGGVFNNDTLAIAFAALALLGAVRVAVGKDSPRDLLILGTILGLGLMTKMTTVWLVGIAGLGVLAAAWRARDWRVLGRAMLYVGVPVAILSGWWIVRNMRLYGVDDPMAWRMFLAAGPDLLRDIPLRDELGAYFRLQYMSFWGSFGWTTIRLPEPVYSALAVIPILGVAGLAILVARRDRLVAENRWGLVLLGIAVVVGYLSAFRLALVFNMVAAHGRYLYPALAPMAVLAAVGLGEPFPESWRRWVLAFVALSLLVLTVASLVWLVRPAFALPAVVTPEDAPQIEHRLDVVFDDRIRLLGYDFSTDRVSAGQPLTVTLYWQATDANWEPFPAVTAAEIGFAHLVDAEGEVVARVDVAPFGGRLPTLAWPPGQTLRQDYDLAVSPDATPGLAELLVGWYPEDHPDEPLPMSRDGEPAGDVLRIDSIVIQPAAPVAIDPAQATPRGDVLGEPPLALLAAYSIGGSLEPGRPVTVTLFWQPVAPMTTSYTVFVHVTDPEGNVIAAGDGLPQDARYPTASWLPGETVDDSHVLEVPPLALPSGEGLGLEVGWYDAATGERVGAYRADGSSWPTGAIALEP